MRAFDARTGKQLWRFNMMPGPGEFGHDTWENDSWNWTGNTGVWTEMSADPEAGLVYLPVESPTIDEYGGNRPGAGLFGETPRGARPEDRQAEVALPDRAPRDLGLRPVRGSARHGRDDRRQAAQDRGTADQAGLALHASTASRASRSGRSSRRRSRSPTSRARRAGRRSRTRPSRRSTRATSWRRRT